MAASLREKVAAKKAANSGRQLATRARAPPTAPPLAPPLGPPPLAPPSAPRAPPSDAEVAARLGGIARHGVAAPVGAAEDGRPEMESEASWDAFARRVGLTVGAAPSDAVRPPKPRGAPLPPLPPAGEAQRERMRTEGYIELAEWGAPCDGETRAKAMAALAAGIDALDAVGLPANFALAFDQTWDALEGLRGTLEPLLGHGLSYDFYVFNVRPGGTGWGMHRERAGADARAGFSDRLPWYNTCWLALTDATPATSCMYALPAPADPGYAGAGGEGDPEDLEAIVGAAHPRVRALPVPAGTALVWSHRLIHWGSAHGGGAGSRKTLACALADEAFEPPLLAARATRPVLGARLALASHLLVRYHHEASHPAPLWPATLRLALTLLERHAHHLSDAALEWYSTAAGRSSPVGHGTLLQCTLARLAAEQAAARAADAGAGSVANGAARTATAEGIEGAVRAVAAYIVHARGLTASDEVTRLAGARPATMPAPSAPASTPAPPAPAAAPARLHSEAAVSMAVLPAAWAEIDYADVE
jgi:hypothetical protein